MITISQRLSSRTLILKSLFAIALALMTSQLGCDPGKVAVGIASLPVITPIGISSKLSDDKKFVQIAAQLRNVGLDDGKGPFKVFMGVTTPGQTQEQRIVFPATETIPGKNNAPPDGGVKTTASIITVPYDPNMVYDITVIVDENGEYAAGANKGKNTLKLKNKLP